MTDFLTFIGRALALLNALVAAGVVKTSTGTNIAGIVGDLQAIVQNGANPTVDQVAAAEKLLTDLQAEGVISGTVVAETAQGLSKFAAFVKNVQANQVAIIDGGKELFGVRGAYAFIPAASEQGVSLGLS